MGSDVGEMNLVVSGTALGLSKAKPPLIKAPYGDFLYLGRNVFPGIRNLI